MKPSSSSGVCGPWPISGLWGDCNPHLQWATSRRAYAHAHVPFAWAPGTRACHSRGINPLPSPAGPQSQKHFLFLSILSMKCHEDKGLNPDDTLTAVALYIDDTMQSLNWIVSVEKYLMWFMLCFRLMLKYNILNNRWYFEYFDK